MNDLVGAVDLRLDGCVESQWYQLGKLYDSLGFMFIGAAVALNCGVPDTSCPAIVVLKNRTTTSKSMSRLVLGRGPGAEAPHLIFGPPILYILEYRVLTSCSNESNFN